MKMMSSMVVGAPPVGRQSTRRAELLDSCSPRIVSAAVDPGLQLAMQRKAEVACCTAGAAPSSDGPVPSPDSGRLDPGHGRCFTASGGSPSVRRAVPHPPVSLPSVALTQAMEILGAHDLVEAQHLARIELWLVRRCPVCRRVMRQMPLLGAEFRVRELLERLAPWERDEHSLRLIAAWLVTHGW